MKVVNIHKRIINQPLEAVAIIISTLSTDDDKVWPYEKWPAMKFNGGIKVGTKGGHGPIRYKVEEYNPKEIIQFIFTSPRGFIGKHKFEIKEVSPNQTEVIHTIDMITKGKDTLSWLIAIRSMHDALLEDALDKIENNFSFEHKKTEWSWWVKFVRKQIAKRNER